MATERSATCIWTGELIGGSGRVSLASGAITDLPTTWASRTSRSDGMTSPEELIAAAHASCFSMALSHGLSQSGFVPETLEVSATVRLEEIDGVPTITTSDLDVIGVVPGIDAGRFIQIATEAGRDCPVSRALGSLEISVRATLRPPSGDGVLDDAEPLDLDADDVA